MTTTNKSWMDWIPLVVSLVAVTFTAMQWHDAREQRRLANESNISFDIDTDRSEKRLGISLRNVGPGVARIHSITFYVDRKAIGDPDDALDQVKLDSNRDHGIRLDVDDAMAAQEVIPLVDYRPRNKDEHDRAIDFFEHHLSVAVEYCAADSRCSRKCSENDGC